MTLKGLHALWRARGSTGRSPRREDFTLQDLKPWLGHLALLEHSPGGGFRFRVCSTAMFPRFGCDATGKLAHELSAMFCSDFPHRLEQAVTSGTPICTWVPVASSVATVTYAELVLPLRHKNERENMLLVGTYKFSVDSPPRDLADTLTESNTTNHRGRFTRSCR